MSQPPPTDNAGVMGVTAHMDPDVRITQSADLDEGTASDREPASGRGLAGFGLRVARSALLLVPALLIGTGAALGEEMWAPSLLRDLAAQLAMLSAVAALLALVMRRWFVAAASIFATGFVIASMSAGRAELADPGAATGSESIVRVLQANAFTSNPRVADVERLVSDTRYDVVVLAESPPELGRALRAHGAGAGLGVVASGPNPPFTQWIHAISRWPIEPWRGGEMDGPGHAGAVVSCPAGRIGLIAVHAASPWARDRWQVGNRTIADAARMATEMADAGLPVMVVGDLNATPTSARTARLVRAGLARAKPVWKPVGTYPARLPWPLKIAIDDAVVSGEFGVRSWRTIPCPGSDHSAVEIELVVSNSGGSPGE